MLRRPNLVGLTSAQEAARQAYEMAGVGAADVEVAEVHDCFTIAEIMAYEDLGFFAKGEGAPFIEEKWWFGQGALRQPEAQSNLTTRGFTKPQPAQERRSPTSMSMQPPRPDRHAFPLSMRRTCRWLLG